MKTIKFLPAFLAIIFLAFSNCQRDVKSLSSKETPVSSSKATPKLKLDMPIVTCFSSSQGSIDLRICAGATGAPAGFSVQWMTETAFIANGSVWPSDDLSVCKASFSGNANGSRYNLLAGECVTVRIGDILFDNGTSSNCPDELVCGTRYVFRSFAHATSSLMRSDFTANITCTTSPCTITIGCTYTQGYWKTHGPVGCNPSGGSNTWPVTSLTIGTVNYTDLQLCSILTTPGAGNGLITLAHQLIAAKLNIANGSNPTAIAATIIAADALIGSLVIPPVGAGSLSPASISALNTALNDYNNGFTGPGHCQ
jgi:hypothetical protein